MQRNILDFKVYKKLQNLFLFYKKIKRKSLINLIMKENIQEIFVDI